MNGGQIFLKREEMQLGTDKEVRCWGLKRSRRAFLPAWDWGPFCSSLCVFQNLALLFWSGNGEAVSKYPAEPPGGTKRLFLSVHGVLEHRHPNKTAVEQAAQEAVLALKTQEGCFQRCVSPPWVEMLTLPLLWPDAPCSLSIPVLEAVPIPVWCPCSNPGTQWPVVPQVVKTSGSHRCWVILLTPFLMLSRAHPFMMLSQ